MAKREVITYTCDNCPTEAESESNITGDWKHPMPKGWVDLNVVSNECVEMSKHLCPRCFSAVKFALLQVSVFGG